MNILTRITCMLFLVGLISCSTFKKPAEPAKHKESNTSPALQVQTFEEADINNDGTLDRQEVEIANKIEESQSSGLPDYLTAFIAISGAALGATIIGMVVSGFRGKPKEPKEREEPDPAEESDPPDDLGLDYDFMGTEQSDERKS